jgi:histidinol-phosphatase
MTATEDLELIQQLADTADGISLKYFAAGAVPTQTKADGSPVTQADREVEQALRDELRDSRPGDLVIGEELGSHGNAERRWILDPIDGTANFSAGRPQWSTLLAVEANSEVVTGMISAPALQRRWWATRSADREMQRGHVSAVLVPVRSLNLRSELEASRRGGW